MELFLRVAYLSSYSGLSYCIMEKSWTTDPKFSALSARLPGNARDGYDEKLSIDKWIQNVTGGGLPQTFYMREAVTTTTTFAEAVDFLLSTPPISPQYLVVAGTGLYQGCSIA